MLTTTQKYKIGDCLDLLPEIENNSIDMVLTSPPYDNLRTYDGYTFDFESTAQELYRVIKKGGVVVWIVSDQTTKGSESGTSFKQALYFKKIGFNLHDTMIWQKTNPMPKIKTKRYFDVFEYMFILSKNAPSTFNPILQNCKLGGKIYNSTCKNIGGEKGRTKKEFTLNKQRYKDNIWKNAIAQNKTKHPAVFPDQLAYDHIISWSNEGDTILDPFVGSGTTLKMCKELNRNGIGFECNPDYESIIKQRLDITTLDSFK